VAASHARHLDTGLQPSQRDPSPAEQSRCLARTGANLEHAIARLGEGDYVLDELLRIRRAGPVVELRYVSEGKPTFHENSVKEYYDTRAPEYDDWYRGTGLFAARERPGWDEAVRSLIDAISSLEAATTLDVACGTGFLTRHLPGSVTALDQSQRMLEITRRQASGARVVQGDALNLPFGDLSFQRVFTGHFYGHLEEEDRVRFLAEARRVAPELVVADSAVQEDRARDGWQTRVLNDGSEFQVFKRYFTGAQLADELGGGEVLHESPWFVLVRAGLPA
jgi:SAM-dependent methyltransferase